MHLHQKIYVNISSTNEQMFQDVQQRFEQIHFTHNYCANFNDATSLDDFCLVRTVRRKMSLSQYKIICFAFLHKIILGRIIQSVSLSGSHHVQMASSLESNTTLIRDVYHWQKKGRNRAVCKGSILLRFAGDSMKREEGNDPCAVTQITES